MRQLTFDGRLGKDAELLSTQSGQQYLRFSVANNTYSKGANGEREEKTDWMDVICFDPFLVKSKQQVLKKGYYVIVTGSLEVSLSTLQDGRQFINQRVNAINIEVPNFGTGKADETGAAQTQAQAAPQMMGNIPPVTPQPQAQPQAQTTFSMSQPTTTVDNDLPF